MPSASSQAHYSQVLTGVAVQYRPPGLVAQDVIPPVKVEFENDVYPVFDQALFDVVDDIRADGGESNEVDMGWRYVPYQCQEHALRAKCTKREKDNYPDPDDLMALKAEQVKQTVLNRLEQRVFGTGGFARNGANVINSRNFDWSDPAAANPRRDVNLLQSDVEVASGMSPNIIVASKETFRAIMRTAQWRDEAKYTNDLRADNDVPAQFYGLRTVTVESLLNTAAYGAARSLARLMGEDVLVAYVDPSGLGNRTLTWAARLYTEEYVRSWYNDERATDFVEYGNIYTLQLVARECAALGTSVLTA